MSGLHCSWCLTSAEPRLAFKVNFFLTLSIVICTNDLGARTEFSCWNAVIIVYYLQRTRLYLERMSPIDVNKSTTTDSSCINQCLLHISTP